MLVVYNHWTGLVDWTKNHFYALLLELTSIVAFGDIATHLHRL